MKPFLTLALAFALFSPLASTAHAQGSPGAAPTEGAAAKARATKVLQRAAAFLVQAQNKNGSFGQIPGVPEPGEIGISALVVRGLAKLPAAARSKAVLVAKQRAVSYLLAQEQSDGTFSPSGQGLVTYRTALVIQALIAVDATRYAEPIARARDALAKGQFSEKNGLEKQGEKSPYYGGWGYDRTGTRPDADMSNTHMAIEALKEAGLPKDSAVWKRAVKFLQRCQNRTESNDVPTKTVVILNDGGFMYDPALDLSKSTPVERADGKVTIPSYASMTYAGLMSLLYAKVKRDDPRVQAAWGWIRAHYTLSENYGLGTRKNPRAGKQGLYYYYHAFAKALSAWGAPVLIDGAGERHHWSRELADHLGALQRKDGSWVNSEPRWWEADPVLVTGYCVLALDFAYPWLEREPKAPAGPDGR